MCGGFCFRVFKAELKAGNHSLTFACRHAFRPCNSSGNSSQLPFPMKYTPSRRVMSVVSPQLMHVSSRCSHVGVPSCPGRRRCSGRPPFASGHGVELKVDTVAHNSRNSTAQKVYMRYETCINMYWVQGKLTRLKQEYGCNRRVHTGAQARNDWCNTGKKQISDQGRHSATCGPDRTNAGGPPRWTPRLVLGTQRDQAIRPSQSSGLVLCGHAANLAKRDSHMEATGALLVGIFFCSVRCRKDAL